MTREYSAHRLDVAGFSEEAATLSGTEALDGYGRLSAEAAGPEEGAVVRWQAVGALRQGSDGAMVPWLHLDAHADVPLVCQRCLAPVVVGLQVDRWFRFVKDEATAELEDDESEEDLLVSSRDFDLHSLIEDELLLAMPVTPRHEVCPEPVRLSVADPDFETGEGEGRNPFAVLGALRSRKPQ